MQWKVSEVEGQQEAVVSHGSAYVSAVKDPTESFGERISGVYDAGDVFKKDVAVLLPLLDGEMLDRDVVGAEVGLEAFTIGIAAWLSSWRVVGPSCGNPSR